jgi:ribosomal protein L11 methyltransferase
MPTRVPAADSTPWLELDLEIAPEEEDRVAAALWACGSVGAWTVRPGLVRGYFDGESSDVEERFRTAWRGTTGEAWDRPLRARGTPERDWLERWRAGVAPVAVSSTLWVVPPGLDFASTVGPGARVIVIQPGQGFGTGSHPTTQALLRWIEAEPGERVLDIGCGSGVLGIAALASGAHRAVGLDLDPDAIANADENRGHNQVGGRMRLVRGELACLAEDARFDRVLANLDGPTLSRLAGDLLARCTPGGRIGVAGLLIAERDGLLGTLLGLGLELLDERTDTDAPSGDGWWSGWLRRRGGEAR